MEFDLKDVLEAIGPSAALVFASWIFLGFLEQRYVAAYERFRKLVEEYRANQSSENRHQNLKDQIRLYRVRCDQMRTATNLGVIAAILLLTALICGALEAIFGGIALIKYLGTACAIVGLLLVIAAAVYVVLENTLIKQMLDSEVADLDLVVNPDRKKQ
jgi:F0F1-type ATP synthase assembly protein I